MAGFVLAANGQVDTSLSQLLGGGRVGEAPPAWLEILKLAVAGLMGMIITTVHKRYQRDRSPSRSLLQAEVLLCVSGALMMIIIGNSAARALGIAGGASIIRFRTPVDDPKDAIVLFLLMGLGMSAGLGEFAVCILGTVFLCVFLCILDRFSEQKPRSILLEVVATSKDFPTEHVCRVLGAEADFYEPVKVTHGNEASVKYNLKIYPGTSLNHLSSRLMDNGLSGVKSVGWEQPKKPD
jgi:hypothetical protein